MLRRRKEAVQMDENTMSPQPTSALDTTLLPRAISSSPAGNEDRAVYSREKEEGGWLSSQAHSPAPRQPFTS